MVTIYFSITYVVSPQMSYFLYSSISKSNDQKEIIQGNLRLLSLQIRGMTCPGCAYILEYHFSNLDGVVKAKVYYPSGNAEIFYNPEKIKKEEIISSLTFTSYEVFVGSDVPV